MNISVNDAGRVRAQVGDVRSAVGVAGTVCVVSSSGVRGTGEVLSSARPCCCGVRTTVSQVLHRVPSARRPFFDVHRGVTRRSHGVNYVMIANSGNVTNTCGRGVRGVARRFVTRRRRYGLCILNVMNHRCFAGGRVSVTRGFPCAMRGPAVRETHLVSRRVIETFLSERLSRIHVFCARVRDTITVRPIGVRLLPLGGTRFLPGRTVLTSVPRRRVILSPSTSMLLGAVVPGCLANLVCKYLMRTCTDRGGTEVVTVRSSASDTGGVLERLSVRCGHTHRTTVARRVARVIDNTGTRGEG